MSEFPETCPYCGKPGGVTLDVHIVLAHPEKSPSMVAQMEAYRESQKKGKGRKKK